jgi:hypothetical protein
MGSTITPQEVARNKKKAKANKQKFRDQRDEYLEEMRRAFKLMQIKYVMTNYNPFSLMLVHLLGPLIMPIPYSGKEKNQDSNGLKDQNVTDKFPYRN